jgi:hypothetical protein
MIKVSDQELLDLIAKIEALQPSFNQSWNAEYKDKLVYGLKAILDDLSKLLYSKD